MTGKEVFRNFTVALPEGIRYWEDDSTGLIIKRGQTVEVNQRQFRSAELRFGLLRSQILIKSGECQFAFRSKLVKIKPGDKKNIIIDIEDKNEKETVPVTKNIQVLPPIEEKRIETEESNETTLDLLEE